MAFVAPNEKATGQIGTVSIGTGTGAVVVGGEKAMAFHAFDDESPNPPRIAVEVYDREPADWPAPLAEVYSGVWGDPVAWAKFNVAELGADMVALQLASTDPNREDTSADDAAALAKKVADAIDVPLIVYGSGNVEKDADVLAKVAEACHGMRIVVGPVKDDNHRTLGAAAMGFDAIVAGESPIDVNMAKQLNILLGNLGVKSDSILIDPSTGSLGYGLEYTYSVIERDRLSALTQNDKTLQMPIISNTGKEVWKTKEAKIGEGDMPAWGDAKQLGVSWEIITATALLVAGADIVMLRHPASIKTMRALIEEMA
jgi:acetyl-CoA decarbonylase/synthase, CODH/ACS complex subunit delta